MHQMKFEWYWGCIYHFTCCRHTGIGRAVIACRARFTAVRGYICRSGASGAAIEDIARSAIIALLAINVITIFSYTERRRVSTTITIMMMVAYDIGKALIQS